MNQLVFKFPFKTKHFEQDFYVSSNNFAAYKLIESWPNLPGKWLNVFGASGSGKTHLGKIFGKKNKNVKLLDERDINDDTLNNLTDINCLIIDNFKNKISEKLLYSILNHSNQLEYNVVINSVRSINKSNYSLKDLKSRIDSFIFIGIELPTDDLLNVIISKTLSDKQIHLSPKISDYIIKNVERSYEKMFIFLKELDEISLSSGKAININLIKKVLKNE